MIWQNYCLETLHKQHVSQMEILTNILYSPVQILPYFQNVLYFSMRTQVSARTSQPSRSFLGQVLTCGCVYVESVWLSPKIFVNEGEQNPLHFEYVSSYLCYNSTCLLSGLGGDATLLVNLQTGVIPCIMKYQNQHPEKNYVGLLMVTLHSIFTIILPTACASTFLQNFGFLFAHQFVLLKSYSL